MSVINARHRSESTEHYTPPDIAERVRNVFRGQLDLDVASVPLANELMQARNFYNWDTNSMGPIKWEAGTVYCNAPGGNLKTKWEKLASTNHPGVLKSDEQLRRDAEAAKRWKTNSSAVAWWRRMVWEYSQGHFQSGIFMGFSVEMLQSAQGEHDGVRWVTPCSFLTCIPAKRIAFYHEVDGKLVEGKAPTHANFITLVSHNNLHHWEFTRQLDPIGTIIKNVVGR